jgi:hypothetical protein
VGANWTVIFRLEPEEISALREGMPQVHAVEEYAISTELLYGGAVEGDAELWLEIDARSDTDAETRAREVYGRARLAAGLPPSEPQIIGFMGPARPRPLHERLVEDAIELLSAGKPELAVVRAQTGCEVLSNDVLADLLRQRGADVLVDAIGKRAPLATPPGQALFTWLTDEQIEQEKPMWPNYKEHLTRRNDIVHRGIEVTEAQAQASLDACNAFRDYLMAAWAKASTPETRS